MQIQKAKPEAKNYRLYDEKVLYLEATAAKRNRPNWSKWLKRLNPA